MSQDFKPLSEVIMNDMSVEQREQLAASVKAVIADLRVDDAALLLPILLKNSSAQEAVLMSVYAFIRNEMKLQIVE
jgi:hypothetical protein